MHLTQLSQDVFDSQSLSVRSKGSKKHAAINLPGYESSSHMDAFSDDMSDLLAHGFEDSVAGGDNPLDIPFDDFEGSIVSNDHATGSRKSSKSAAASSLSASGVDDGSSGAAGSEHDLSHASGADAELGVPNGAELELDFQDPDIVRSQPLPSRPQPCLATCCQKSMPDLDTCSLQDMGMGLDHDGQEEHGPASHATVGKKRGHKKLSKYTRLDKKIELAKEEMKMWVTDPEWCKVKMKTNA